MPLKNRPLVKTIEIIPYTTTTAHNGRRGSPAIPAGTKVYLIGSKLHHVYYHFSYLRLEDAETVLPRLQDNLDDRLIQWNFKSDPERCQHVKELITNVNRPASS